MEPTLTPVEQHGQLGVSGTDLCDESGKPVQLRGMSSHGLQWFGWGDCLTPGSLDALAADWQADCFRIALYVQEGGYETDPLRFTAELERVIEAITDRGLYAIIDFHIRDPGNPLENLGHAKRLFERIAATYGDQSNIIYEICNEPNGVGWESVKAYAEAVLPVIRAHDPDSPVVVGTPGWSSLGMADEGSRGPQAVLDSPVSDDNTLYAYHFYAATHGRWERQQLTAVADELPIFVTECGSMEATGDGRSDFERMEAFLDCLANHGISWVGWNYADGPRSSCVWQAGTSVEGRWTGENLTETGRWLRRKIRDGC